MSRTSSASSSTQRIVQVFIPSPGLCLKLDPEPASLTEGAFHSGPASHALHGSRHNGQSDACARILFRLVEPFEHLENACVILGGDADAVVFYPEAQAGVALLGSEPDFRADTGDREFKGV